MFVRVLFFLLLALNLGGGAWLAFAHPRMQKMQPLAATDPGVPKLVLLSERDGTTGVAELATAPETAAERANDVCRSFGPFPTQADARAAMGAVTPLAKRVRTRETRTTQTRGYWVYLPAVAHREEALATARALSAKDVRDYYVVTAGDAQNTISLGLFRDQNNAERRRAELVGLGFKPQIATRTEEAPQYWLDFALAEAEPTDLRARLAARADQKVDPVSCF